MNTLNGHRGRLLGLLLAINLLDCGSNSTPNEKELVLAQAQIDSLIREGNGIYAQKKSYNGFMQSMELYDVAWQKAVLIKDSLYLARTVYAKGRAYDAINSNPQKTIEYYSEAARLYKGIPQQYNKALYIKHLVAHAYDKIGDSTHCIGVLQSLYDEIATKSDSEKINLPFTAEMALISTEVKNYAMSNAILKNLTKRDWIKNDPGMYDYLNHYYLTKARIEVFGNNNGNTVYLDSLALVYQNSKNISDSIYFGKELHKLYKHARRLDKEGEFLKISRDLEEKYFVQSSMTKANDKILKMETASIEQKREVEQKQAEQRKTYIILLSVFLSIITFLSFFLYRKNKEVNEKKNETLLINKALSIKNIQNELLNKEIHHRVKNNLQMILSLVYMQERNSESDEVKENMQNIRLRIESIAELHQQLMEEADVVDFRRYIQQLVANVSNLLGDDKKVLTYLEIQALKVPQKISFPLGLIINEWITNSIKYAQPTTTPLTIGIEIFNGNNEIKVRYRDNGEPQTEKPNKKALGLSIVHLLLAQLNATLKQDAENIFNYDVIIPFTDGE